MVSAAFSLKKIHISRETFFHASRRTTKRKKTDHSSQERSHRNDACTKPTSKSVA
jgi:hypothetical protein